ncbi:MAG: MBL fold metallo-hydrolase [Oscillospiraceae bacterium]|nr:MBL fold metallo-hydrolase [Oscillospiraceae bacterium]
MLNVQTLVVGMVSTNCYIISDAETREATVIDPGDRADKILGVLRENGLAARYIFLTHGHFDHVLALEEVRLATGAKAIIHQDDAIYLRDAALSNPFGFAAAAAEPEILTRQGETFSLGGHILEVLHTPGHTPGSMCLRADSLLFTGDTLFEDDCGRCDLPGGDYDVMLQSLRFLASLEGDYTVYPGHDVSTTLDRERKHNVNMREALESR